MARPRTVSDDAIRQAAREVFLEHGPGASVNLIAERLGVTHAAVFGRAGNKVQLMLESLSPGSPKALDLLAEAVPASDAVGRLRVILVELMVFLREIVPGLVVLKAAGHSMGQLPSQQKAPPPVALRWALTRWLERAVEAGTLAPMRCWAVAEGLLGALEARCFNGYLGGPTFAPGADEVFVRELVDGLVKVKR